MGNSSSSAHPVRASAGAPHLHPRRRWHAVAWMAPTMLLFVVVFLLMSRSSPSVIDLGGSDPRTLDPVGLFSQTAPAASEQWRSPSSSLCHDLAVVLCVGDSITYGNGSRTTPGGKVKPLRGNYPMVLQQLLNDACSRNGRRSGEALSGVSGIHGVLLPNAHRSQPVTVVNLGRSGMTLVDGTDLSYRNSTEYQRAIVQAPTARWVVIMLGTNDSKQWKRGGSSGAVFEAALVALIQVLSVGGANVVVVAPPPALPTPQDLRLGKCRVAFDVKPQFIRGGINRACASAARRTKARFLDLYRALTTMADPVAAELRRLTAVYPDCASVSVVDALSRRSVADRLHDATNIARYYEDGLHPTALLSNRIAENVAAYLLRSQ